jgi:glucokinase
VLPVAFAGTVNEQLYLGVEIGGTKLQVVLGNDHAAIIDRRRFTVDRAAGGAGIRNQIARATTDYLRHHRITAAGIGFGGPIDWKTGRIALSHHIEGWADFEITSWMQDLVHVPVQVDNDANTAALAEALRGAGKHSNPVFYVTLGSGVGGGLVVNGAIFHGATPGEAEIGHVRLDKSGTTIERRCSGWAVDRRIRESLADHPDSVLAKVARGTSGGEAKHLRKALEAGDDFARRIVEETAEDLAFGLSHVTHLVHPEMIILGGGLSLLGELLREPVQRHHKRFLMEAFQPGPAIRIAVQGEDVVPIGALLLAKAAAGR